VHHFCIVRFQKHAVRIIVGNFYENKARVIFCEAFELKMFGAKYAWIITGMRWTGRTHQIIFD